MKIKNVLCALLAAIIWGTAFSMQSICSEYLPVFAINAFRFSIGAVALTVAGFIFRIDPGSKKDLIKAGLISGVALFLGANLQQFGIGETSAGKAGFVTALYIVLVPVFGLFLRQKTGINVWFAVALSVVGMFFLCTDGSFSIEIGDISLLCSAAAFAVQILAADHYLEKVHPVALSAAQFFVNAVLGLAMSLLTEHVALADFAPCIMPLLYIAVFSTCGGYTLQMVAQKDGNPTVISLVLSLESVFAVISGMLLLGERLTGRELTGCLLMVFAVVLAQIPFKVKNR